MRIKLDRTVCEGFGVCAQHSDVFETDEWGYASLTAQPPDTPEIRRAVLDCPVRAITDLDDPGADPRPARGGRARRSPTPGG